MMKFIRKTKLKQKQKMAIQYNIRLIKVDRTQLQTRHSKNHTYRSNVQHYE